MGADNQQLADAGKGLVIVKARRSLLEKKPIVHEKLQAKNILEEIFLRKDIVLSTAEEQSPIN